MRRFSKTGLHLLVSTTIVVAVQFLYDPIGQAQSSVETVSVLGPRPLSDALLELEKRHRWLVTYEDAYYEYRRDLVDVTDVVSKRFDPKGPRVLAAPSRTFIFNYLAADVARPEAVLASLVDTYHDLWKEYEYQLLRQGAWFHVVPASSKNSAGERRARPSRLDVRVTIPEAERTVEDTIAAVLAAVNQSSPIRIGGGGMRIRLLAQRSVRTGARNEIARDVLVRALDATGRKVRWHLLCGAMTSTCQLNLCMLE